MITNCQKICTAFLAMIFVFSCIGIFKYLPPFIAINNGFTRESIEKEIREDIKESTNPTFRIVQLENNSYAIEEYSRKKWIRNYFIGTRESLESLTNSWNEYRRVREKINKEDSLKVKLIIEER